MYIYYFAQGIEGLPNVPLNDNVLQSILSYVFGLAGVIALIMMLVGSIKYIYSRGDSNAIKSAKETIIYALVGLIVSVFSIAITTFIFGSTT